ncbi:hypothetical protein FOZ62_012981 [Perkinsus olseni]|nr:hypothetical protein FOZ62_012981 [Perkinsus olseni]
MIGYAEDCAMAAAEEPDEDMQVRRRRATAGAKWAEKHAKTERGIRRNVIYTDEEARIYIIATDSLVRAAGSRETLDFTIEQYARKFLGKPSLPWRNFDDFKAISQNAFIIDRENYCCTCYNCRFPPCEHSAAVRFLEGLTVANFEWDDLVTYGQRPTGRPR